MKNFTIVFFSILLLSSCVKKTAAKWEDKILEKLSFGDKKKDDTKVAEVRQVKGPSTEGSQRGSAPEASVPSGELPPPIQGAPAPQVGRAPSRDERAINNTFQKFRNNLAADLSSLNPLVGRLYGLWSFPVQDWVNDTRKREAEFTLNPQQLDSFKLRWRFRWVPFAGMDDVSKVQKSDCQFIMMAIQSFQSAKKQSTLSLQQAWRTQNPHCQEQTTFQQGPMAEVFKQKFFSFNQLMFASFFDSAPIRPAVIYRYDGAGEYRYHALVETEDDLLLVFAMKAHPMLALKEFRLKTEEGVLFGEVLKK